MFPEEITRGIFRLKSYWVQQKQLKPNMEKKSKYFWPILKKNLFSEEDQSEIAIKKVLSKEKEVEKDFIEILLPVNCMPSDFFLIQSQFSFKLSISCLGCSNSFVFANFLDFLNQLSW